jgi:YVTN family beta-propeller protein
MSKHDLVICLAIFALVPLLSARSAPAPSHGLLIVANKGDQTIGIIDPEAGREIATIKESGFTVHEVIASPDGHTAYAPVYGNSGVGSPGTDGQTIDVIDIPSRKIVKTIDLGKPSRPHCPKFGPDGRLYVSTEITKSVTIIDPKTDQVVGSLPTDQVESHMIVITSDGKRIYTSNVHVGTVSAIDVASAKVLAVIQVSPHAQRISISRDDLYAFTADQTKPRLAVIETATNKVTNWIALPTLAYGTAPTPDGHWLLVALPDLNALGVVDLKAMKMVRQVAVGKYPQEVVVRPDGKVAYVSCMNEGKVAAVNLETWKTDQLIPAGKGVDGLAWAEAH